MLRDMKQVVRKGLRRRSFIEELLPPWVKELESPKLSQYRVRVQEVEDREVQWCLVLVEMFQLNKEKS